MIKIIEFNKTEEKVDVKIEVDNEIKDIELPHEEFNFLMYINNLVTSEVLTEAYADELFETVANLNRFYFEMGQLAFRQYLEQEMTKQNLTPEPPDNFKKTDSGLYIP